LSGLASIIAGIHAITALRLQQPHWQLTDADAKKYSAAWANVLRHYKVAATQKAIDHFALLMVAVEIETPRFVLSSQLKQAAQRRPAGFGATVYPLRPGAAPATAEPSGEVPGLG
jgi:hypothetical protein